MIPRALGCGDALDVVPLCRACHRAYDAGELDLLPYLEPGFRAQVAHAVGHVGLIGALQRICGIRAFRKTDAGAKADYGEPDQEVLP